MKLTMAVLKAASSLVAAAQVAVAGDVGFALADLLPEACRACVERM